jgi:hypothetical protein
VVLVTLYTLGRWDAPWSLSPAYYTAGITLGKVYSNSILALLNNRAEIVGGRNMCVDDWGTLGLRSSMLREEVREGVDGTAVTSSFQMRTLGSGSTSASCATMN